MLQGEETMPRSVNYQTHPLPDLPRHITLHLKVRNRASPGSKATQWRPRRMPGLLQGPHAHRKQDTKTGTAVPA